MTCPFVQKWLERHPDERDLVAPARRRLTAGRPGTGHAGWGGDMRFLLHLVVTAVAFWVATQLVSGLSYEGPLRGCCWSRSCSGW